MTTDNKALLALADEVERLARRYWTHHKRAVLASHLRALATQQPEAGEAVVGEAVIPYVAARALLGDAWTAGRIGDALFDHIKKLQDAIVIAAPKADESAELKRLRVENKLRANAVDRWVPCPDHRDKTERGKCYMCENESLRRQLEAPKAEAQEADEYEFEVWQNDAMQAGGSGPAEMVITEAEHYALMYGQDGPVELRYYARRRIDEAALSAQRAEAKP